MQNQNSFTKSLPNETRLPVPEEEHPITHSLTLALLYKERVLLVSEAIVG